MVSNFVPLLFTIPFASAIGTSNRSSSDAIQDPILIDPSFIITTITSVLHIILFALWLQITYHYLGDIGNFCGWIIANIEDTVVARDNNRGRDNRQLVLSLLL
mmetsp:Transcript_32659/g.68987  ORF Transcript_32659/g.68987 Transcript_32659/m.68987 type:complete len:103 (+) Transcript_32659:295-603(+)